MTAAFVKDGYCILPYDKAVAEWAEAALIAARVVVQTPGDLRHGETWRVGVDELPTAPDGSIGGVALRGGWDALIDPPSEWHRAQLSVVYPGYPQQDPQDSDTAHGYRLRRDAAHVDGLLPEGPQRRRHLREPHAFILGIPLNMATQSPLVVWEGSHHLMQAAFAKAFAGVPPAAWGDVDVTDIYQTARKTVFATCRRRECPVRPGQATLVHRHCLHGVAPWQDNKDRADSRMIAYFRPHLTTLMDWL